MSLYIRLYTSFFSHRKTRRLRSIIGDDAFWVPPRLWAYAATNQPDGNFKDYLPEDIAAGIGYTKDAQALLEALLEAQFLDKNMKIHDWAVHSGFHELYAARAKKAATIRWEKEKNQKKEETEKNTTELRGAELKKHCLEHTSSTASSMLQAGKPPNGKFTPSINELQKQINNAKELVKGIESKMNPTPKELEDREGLLLRIATLQQRIITYTD